MEGNAVWRPVPLSWLPVPASLPVGRCTSLSCALLWFPDSCVGWCLQNSRAEPLICVTGSPVSTRCHESWKAMALLNPWEERKSSTAGLAAGMKFDSQALEITESSFFSAFFGQFQHFCNPNGFLQIRTEQNDIANYTPLKKKKVLLRRRPSRQMFRQMFTAS